MSATLQDVTLRGNTVITGTVALPAGSIGASNIAAGAGIETSKMSHRIVIPYGQANGASIADATAAVHIVRAATGTLVSVEVAILTAAVGDSTVTVDLQKSTSAGAFATMLTVEVEIDSSTVVRTAEAATLASTALVDGDILAIVVDATAGTGTLPQGLVVTITLDEVAV